MENELKRRIGRFYKEVGKNVRTRRTAADLSQSQLAEAVGLTRTSITNLEAGRQQIPLHVLARIAAVLEIWPGDLLPEMSVFDDTIAVPDLTKPLADADERMRRFVQSTVAKAALSSRKGSAT
jgi:transcriptional regulator with XRE-family HTH domain